MKAPVLSIEESAAQTYGISVQELSAAWERAMLKVYVGTTEPMPTQSYFHMGGPNRRRRKRRTKKNNAAFKRMEAATNAGKIANFQDILDAMPGFTEPPPNPYPKIKVGRPLPHRLLPVMNEDTSYMNKPMRGGGFWTSTYLGSVHISDWAEWCRAERFPYPGEYRSWLLHVDPKAFVIELDGPESCAELERLGYMYVPDYYKERGLSAFANRPQIDWEKLASVGVDGVHLTERGNSIMHLNVHVKPGDREYDFNSWDAESTCWIRWAFTDVQPGPKVTIPEHMKYEDEDAVS